MGHSFLFILATPLYVWILVALGAFVVLALGGTVLVNLIKKSNDRAHTAQLLDTPELKFENYADDQVQMMNTEMMVMKPDDPDVDVL